MKRVTLLVESADRIGEAYVVRFPNDTEPLYLHERHVVATEHVPDPLPTEPGVRFWGKSNRDAEPQWWFSTNNTSAGPLYIPATGVSIAEVNAETMGLVRLPDPDGAS